MDNKLIIKENTFKASVSEVWEALTIKEKMKEWYFDVSEFRAEPGFEFQFYGGDENKQWLHICKILEVIPEKKLVHTWTYEEVPGDSILTWELTDINDKTEVKLKHEIIKDFQTESSSFKPESFNAGWEYIVNTSLKEYVEK